MTTLCICITGKRRDNGPTPKQPRPGWRLLRGLSRSAAARNILARVPPPSGTRITLTRPLKFKEMFTSVLFNSPLCGCGVCVWVLLWGEKHLDGGRIRHCGSVP